MFVNNFIFTCFILCSTKVAIFLSLTIRFVVRDYFLCMFDLDI